MSVGKAALLIVVLIIFGLVAMGPSIVVVASILALFTMVAIALLSVKLPLFLRRAMVTHDLAADGIITVSTYILLGGTLTALMAAAMVGCLSSAILMVLKEYDTEIAKETIQNSTNG